MRQFIFISMALLAMPRTLLAQAHEHHHDAGQAEDQEHEHMDHAGAQVVAPAFRVPHGREGSGTSWLPDSSPVFAHHFVAGDWTLMLHYSAEAGYDVQWGDRGSSRFAAVNWIMGMASHPLLGGDLMLRTMLSAEPATMGGELQLPLLLQSGETYGGAPLHDRQHPHDFFMEVAALYRHPLGNDLGFEVYAAPSGEPALGPPAFMHRVSAMYNPFPPIGHHWQDSTHISFGVLSAGLYTRWAKLEGSLFHGREPDEDRWNIDLGPLDSWSGRLSVNPTEQTSLQVSYGYVHSPEATEPDVSLHRVTASGAYTAPVFSEGTVALTALWGRNIESGHASDSALVEGTLSLDGRNVPFVRLEYVHKLGHDLVVPGDPDAKYGVLQAQLGYVHRFTGRPIVPFIGATMDIGVVPASLEALYGTRTPVGAFVFIGLQPATMSTDHAHMRGM
jgi:hypothetical protein